MEPLQVWRFLVLAVAAQTVADSPDQPSYLLLTPQYICPGVQTGVSITILTPATVAVSADIIHDELMVASATTLVEGGATEMLTLPPVYESMTSHRLPYVLEVKGHIDGVKVFSNSTRLVFLRKNVSTFIQTDRWTYQPGQEVKIRGVSISPDGKPYDGPVDLVIRDPHKNALRQWLGLDSTLGVVSQRFNLSDNPPLGKWSIIATVNGVATEKHFKVAFYVLPKFEVVVHVPSRVYRDETVWGSVSAKYSYGKPVLGWMNVTFFYNYNGYEDVFHDYRDVMIDGEADFMFDVPDHEMMSRRSLEMLPYGKEFVVVVAHVTEELSGLTYYSRAKVCLTRSMYDVSFLNHPTVLRPSMNFHAMLKVCRYDGQPPSPEDQMRTVVVKVTQTAVTPPWPWPADMGEDALPPNATTSPHPDEMMPERMELPVPPDGLIPLHVWIWSDTQTLTIDAEFEGSYKTLRLNRWYTSPSQSYLQIQSPPSPLQVGSPVQLSVESSFPMMDVHYLVKSRGQVVSVGRSSGGLSLVPEPSWAPMACIMAFYIHDNGEIVNDVVWLPVDPALQNQVSLSWSQMMVAPKDHVTLRVMVAEPASLVGIMVVDKATQWAGSGNDITQDVVLKEMMGGGGSKGDAHLRNGDPYSVFKACDLMALTDALLPMMKHEQNPDFEWEVVRPTQDMKEEQEVRDDFPETWLWTDVDTGGSTTAELEAVAPDTITTWVASAFVMSPNLGLGVVKAPEELMVFQDFFMSLTLPAFIIRGEELVLEIILFNYLQEDLEVTVTVHPSDAFEFIIMNNADATPAVRRQNVESQKGASVLVPIRPLVLGDLAIMVDANSPMAYDTVMKMVLVKAEGVEQFFSSSLLLEPSSPPSVSRDVMFSFPADVVEGSQRVELTVVGDLLGPSISGLGALILLPSGCGEQNMINFAPNVYVLRYLTATGTGDADTRDRALGFMMIGYERQLSYRWANGAFSAFGESDQSGSTWLTAFVLRSFLQARRLIDIDPNVIDSAAAFLSAHQGADGRFLEMGRVIHTELQGGLDGPTSLTAYVLMALLEDDAIRAQYSVAVASAVSYLEARLDPEVSSNYSLALLTYALALANSSLANNASLKLIGRADVTDGVPSWSSPEDGPSSSWQPRSADIEMVSYLLLSQHALGLVADSIHSAKWLSQQRNYMGGYGSTQDTVMALQALSMFTKLTASQDIDLHLWVTSDPGTTVASFYVDRDNYLIHQSQQIDPEAELNLRVTAEGKGLVLFQLNVFYNIRGAGPTRARRGADDPGPFDLFVEVFDSEENSIHLYICTTLMAGLSWNATGMAVMEVGLLSGFALAPDAMTTDGVVRKVELQRGKVVVYLDSVTPEEICLLFHLVLEQKVAKSQNATVSVIDYYKPWRRAVRSYNSPWRSNMTSGFFCGEDNHLCQDDPQVSAGRRCSARLLLTGLSAALMLLLPAHNG
ncbi:CD109 antigen [Antennarius striatus]|uniref:CD109 antigen n=1 Tax=Antennarius striatus TaxID=241820 RepID=UPI0035B08A8E